MRTQSKISVAGYIVAFVIAALAFLPAIKGQIFVIPFALIPLIAGIEIMRLRVWGAYGFTIFLIAQLLLLPILFLRQGSSAVRWPEIAAVSVLNLILVAFFSTVGRSLAAAGAPRGRALPWILVSALCTLPFFFVQAFVMPSGSMEDTLLIGDRILVRHFPKCDPERGDIVAFVYPIDRSQSSVKRIIGIPGDHIKISGKVVYRNGIALKEPYVTHKFDEPNSYNDNFPSEPVDIPLQPAAQEMLSEDVRNGEVVVTDGKYFVLGDNRDNSLDSRYWGFIERSDIIGEPFLIYDSEEQSPEDALNGAATSSHQVRWNRLFKLL